MADGTRARPPIGDGWYAGIPGVEDAGRAIRALPLVRHLPTPITQALLERSLTRGALLFAASARRPAIVVMREGPGWGMLLLLRALFGRRRKLITIQHIVHRRRHPLRAPLEAYDRWATRRALLRGHALTRAEAAALPRYYGLPADRFRFVPFVLMRHPELPPVEPSANRIVLAAGRAYCDWETVFSAARGAGWPLVVVCARADAARVERLSEGTAAIVHTDLAEAAYLALVRSAVVCVIAISEDGRSAGHVRLGDAYSNAVPAVVSSVSGVVDYVRDGETALLVPPRNAAALRSAVDRLRGDHDLHAAIRAGGLHAARAWRVEDYFSALGRFVSGRPLVLPANAPGQRVDPP